MNAVAALALPDVQNEHDSRGIDLDEVGINGLSYPVTLRRPDGSIAPTVVEAEMTASLAATQRGTHMSRFVEVLHGSRDYIDPATPLVLARTLRDRLGVQAAAVRLRGPLFITRIAPASTMESLLRIDTLLEGHSSTACDTVRLGVSVPVTSLCPCSKEISDYGAHSQRGRVQITVEDSAWASGREGLWPDDLLAIADAAASAPVIPLLKRPDERQVTMAAYDKPAFVEDVARDVASPLIAEPSVASVEVDVTNAESIHDHQAIARVRWSR